MVFTSGSHYEGNFKVGLPDGQGTYTSLKDGAFSGYFSNGCYKSGNRMAFVGTTKEACGY